MIYNQNQSRTFCGGYRNVKGMHIAMKGYRYTYCKRSERVRTTKSKLAYSFNTSYDLLWPENDSTNCGMHNMLSSKIG